MSEFFTGKEIVEIYYSNWRAAVAGFPNELAYFRNQNDVFSFQRQQALFPHFTKVGGDISSPGFHHTLIRISETTLKAFRTDIPPKRSGLYWRVCWIDFNVWPQSNKALIMSITLSILEFGGRKTQWNQLKLNLTSLNTFNFGKSN